VTFHKWKSKFGGLEVSGARRLRSLEEENSRLKKLLADPLLSVAVATATQAESRRTATSSSSCWPNREALP
jgi:hypothetical protein